MIEAQSPEKQEFIRKSIEFWNPGKTQFWQDVGVDLVIDRREGYFLYDMDGRRLIDVHLNGGTYNIGHRHPELVEVLNRGTERFDMGNHHFPALGRTALAEKLAKSCGGDLHYTIYGSRRRRGDRHRDQDRAPRQAEAQDRLDRQGLSRPYRPRGRDRRRTASPSCSCPTGRTSSPACRSTT